MSLQHCPITQPPSRTAFLLVWAVLAIVLVTAGACTDSDADAAVPVPDLVAKPDPLDTRSADALSFFIQTEPTCAEYSLSVGNPGPSPHNYTYATVSRYLNDGLWLITDGQGRSLVVDMNQRAIYPPDGPDGILPHDYSFGCPPEIYLGSAAS